MTVMFLAALDQTIVAAAGPSIVSALGIGPSLYAWVTTSYLVTSTLFVPIYGKLADTYGRKPVLLVGTIIFLVASVLCALAQTGNQLIITRGLQGIGSASIFTSVFTMIADLFVPAERGRYSGLFGGVYGVASLVGPLLGGFITDHFGWHWVFMVNLPVGAVALVIIVVKLPGTLARPVEERVRLDLVGALLLACAVVPILITFSMLGHGSSLAAPVGALAFAVIAIYFFIRWENRAEDPLIDLSLFRIPTVSLGSIVLFLLGGVFLSPIIYMPLFIHQVLASSATEGGAALTPLVFGIFLGNVSSGQILTRVLKYKPMMLVSNALLAIALIVMALTLSPTSTKQEIFIKLFFIGLGLGPNIPLYLVAIQNAVAPNRMGVITSVTTFSRQVGSTMGIALSGLIFASTLNGVEQRAIAEAAPADVVQIRESFELPANREDSLAKRQPSPTRDAAIHQVVQHGYTEAMRAVFVSCLVVTLLALLLTFWIPSVALRRTR